MKHSIILVVCIVCFALIAQAGWSDGMRNIASFTADYYFDGAYNIQVIDVFLAKVCPGFSIQARISNSNSQNSMLNTVGIGPVISFTDNLYTDIRYSAGFDSAWTMSHEGEINLTYETDTSSVSVGTRGSVFPDSAYWYLIPTAGGSLAIDQLRLLLKLFLAADSTGGMNGSLWGEAGWAFTPGFVARTGFTVSYSGQIGYSILAGLDISFNEYFQLKYKFMFLSNTVNYSEAPSVVYGIENVLMADIKIPYGDEGKE